MTAIKKLEEILLFKRPFTRHVVGVSTEADDQNCFMQHNTTILQVTKGCAIQLRCVYHQRTVPLCNQNVNVLMFWSLEVTDLP